MLSPVFENTPVELVREILQFAVVSSSRSPGPDRAWLAQLCLVSHLVYDVAQSHLYYIIELPEARQVELLLRTLLSRPPEFVFLIYALHLAPGTLTGSDVALEMARDLVTLCVGAFIQVPAKVMAIAVADKITYDVDHNGAAMRPVSVLCSEGSTVYGFSIEEDSILAQATHLHLAYFPTPQDIISAHIRFVSFRQFIREVAGPRLTHLTHLTIDHDLTPQILMSNNGLRSLVKVVMKLELPKVERIVIRLPEPMVPTSEMEIKITEAVKSASQDFDYYQGRLVFLAVPVLKKWDKVETMSSMIVDGWRMHRFGKHDLWRDGQSTC